MVEHRTLTPLVLVRIQLPQPKNSTAQSGGLIFLVGVRWFNHCNIVATGSKTSRFHKCNAVKSLRFARKQELPRESSWIGQSAIGTHDQYADEQLATMQKRICLIEFLRLWLVTVYQGTAAPTKIKLKCPNGAFLYFCQFQCGGPYSHQFRFVRDPPQELNCFAYHL